MTHSGGNRAATGDQQHIAVEVLADMVQRAGHTQLKLAVARHALGADDAVHPLRQTVTQQPKVMAVKLGCIGLFEFVRIHRGDDGFAVKFVQTRPLQSGSHACHFVCCAALHAFENCCAGLQLATQGASQHRIEAQSFLTKIVTQSCTLLLSQLTQMVIVCGTKRSLAMAYKVKGSHAANLNDATPALLSHERPGLSHCGHPVGVMVTA